MMNSTKAIGQLYRLAGLYNIQAAYYGVRHQRHRAPVESLLAVLQALGAPVASLNDVSDAWRERVASKWQRVLEPVTVAWDGAKPVFNITLPEEGAEAPCAGRLETETGESYHWRWQSGALPVLESAEIEGRRYAVRQLTLPQSLPYGYHKFIFEVKGKSSETMIISAPRRTFSPPAANNNRGWGAFLPLYALKTAHDWGCGDYPGLGALADWVAEKGGNAIGTLPLLPVFLDKPYEPSPYAPVSRLLWNELYVDIAQAPELANCPEAQELLQSSAYREEIEDLRKQPLVDYRRIIALKRRAMEELVRRTLKSDNKYREDFRRFAAENPVVEEYAKFRAALEKQPRAAWPQRLQNGILQDGDYDEIVKNYHLYAQWLARRQVGEVAEKAGAKGVSLYFDLPLGVHPDGYDVWRFRDIFTGDVSTGAPPDPVFTTGQNWGFPPLHPEKIRAQGYRYIRDYLHHHLQYANMLRIDHVMGLHRLYWIPRGIDAAQGVYVGYNAEEMYAVLAVESQRHRSVIVGEDLGIVPGYIRPAMARHGLHRMYILYYELADNAAKTPRTISRRSIASLNTHDMPPFASFWEGEDIKENIRLGILPGNQETAERENRQVTKNALASFLRKSGFWKNTGESAREALKACLAFLSSGAAATVLINLEDLWLETRAQNVPGTGDRFPSWQRKARYALEEFCRLDEVSDILKEVKRQR